VCGILDRSEELVVLAICGECGMFNVGIYRWIFVALPALAWASPGLTALIRRGNVHNPNTLPGRYAGTVFDLVVSLIMGVALVALILRRYRAISGSSSVRTVISFGGQRREVNRLEMDCRSRARNYP
jgi:hypothetical protein